MYTLEELTKIAQNKISELKLAKKPVNLYKPLDYILDSGGKRIRPVLVLMAYNLYKDDIEYAIDPAISLELFHNFTLIHDDIMDKSDKRRNKLTVHKKWDTNTAILSGDALMIKSYEYLFSLNQNHLKNVIKVFNNTAIKVCEGQQYDMDFEKEDHVSSEDYLKMIRLKTSELIAGALKIGALMADAPTNDIQNIYEFGINTGLAFQLRDDLLDIYGDEKQFGKKIGKDILSRKKTFLLLKALELSDNAQKNKIIDTLNSNNLNNNEKIDSIKKTYDFLSIKNITINEIDLHYNKSLENIDSLCVKKCRLTELIKFSEKLKNRYK